MTTIKIRARLFFALAGWVLSFLTVGSAWESRAAFVEPEAQALAALRASSSVPVDARFEAGFPRSLRFDVPAPTGGTPAQAALAFLRQKSELFSQDHGDLALVPIQTQHSEFDFVSFQQTFRGIPVYGAQLGVGVLQNAFGAPPRILDTTGWLLPATPALDAIDMVPAITPQIAENAARSAVGNPGAATIGETSLVVFSRAALGEVDAAGPRLAWRVTLVSSARQLLIDANTGQELYRHSLAADGAGLSDYDARLRDGTGGTLTSTGCFLLGLLGNQVGNESGLYPQYINDPEAKALWWHTRNTYQAFHDLLGLHSFDDDDAEIVVYIHSALTNNAQYTQWCEYMEFSDQAVGLDIVAHEFTHGVIDNSSDLDYQGQSGALNEAFADALATLVVDPDDWLLGEGLLNGEGPIRSMSDPLNGLCDMLNGAVVLAACGSPDRWSVRRDFNVSFDSGNVHFNSGIQNKATYLMAEGGTFNGHSITGMGKDKTRRLLFSMTRFLEPEAATFSDARGFAVAVAQGWVQHGWYGFTPADVCSVRNAYAAVELGNPDLNCDGVEEAADGDSDGVLDVLDNCVGFSNPSQTDVDNDGIGDACDSDGDNDGISNGADKCPTLFTDWNGNIDSDGDGLGKACDPDDDNDGVADALDNCPTDPNPTQADANNNGKGDACDPDRDLDGHFVGDDNCTFVANPDQADADGDGLGDACDACPNTPDPTIAYTTGYPELGILPKPDQPDSDGDGIPDLCDPYAFGSTEVYVGGQGWNPNLAPQPDGVLRPIDLVGTENSSVRIPIHVCDPGGDPYGYAASEYVQLAFQRLPPSIQGAVVDDSGRIESRVSAPGTAPGAADRGLRFKARCNRKHFLLLDLGAGFPGSASFDLLPSVVQGGGGTLNPWSSPFDDALPAPPPLPDADGDGVVDSVDICPVVSDPSQENRDRDRYGDVCDNCPFYASPSQSDVDLDRRGDECECGDQNRDGGNTVADLVAINVAIFNPALATPLCDANNDGRCNVGDIIAANIEIFSPTNTSTCSRQPVPGP